MNHKICSNDTNWSDTLDYEKIDAEIFETVFYTLNFLSNNRDCKLVHQLIFDALTEKRSYYDRVLFHAVTTYLYMSKGIDNGSLNQWVRIIKNLTLNSRIDEMDLYLRAIDGINKLSVKWDSLIEYFAENGSVAGFSLEQIEEEKNKAELILQSKDFAEAIYEAEQHPYFSGQIRSALHFSIGSEKRYNVEAFSQYWGKISLLFDETRPKHGNLLRQALLTFGDYTLTVSDYKTLCVDDPNEAARTPSLKRLFSNHSIIIKQLLDALNLNDDIESQLKSIVNNSSVPKKDWRYCFIKFPELFTRMSTSHLRLREVSGELIAIPNKSSNGYNYEVFSLSLYELLKQNGFSSTLEGDLGTWADRYLYVDEFYVRFKEEKFVAKDKMGVIVFETKTDDPIAEVAVQLDNISVTR